MLAHNSATARVALFLLPALVAFAAWWQVSSFGFLFDDNNALVDNEALRSGDWWSAAFGACTPLSNRPMACLSLALDFQLGLSPGGMHVVNLLIHAANALLVCAVAREVLRGDLLAASLCACLWAVHPLVGDAVAYLTQRTMLLMASFALLAFLALLRAGRSPRPLRWQALCVAASALTMASKEEAVGLPLLLMLAHRAFCLPTWAAWRGQWRFHLALVSTWAVLLLCVLLGPDNPAVGYAASPHLSAWDWLLTQTQCLSHYVRSVFVPDDLRGMYDFPFLRSVRSAILPGLACLVAVAVTVGLWRRHPRMAFAGSAFFLLLAPTSSFLPLPTEPCADRRMYLPLLSFLVPLTTIALRLPRPVLVTCLATLTLLLAWRAQSTAAPYRDPAAFFAHAAASNELTNGSFQSGRILAAHSRVLREAGRIEDADAAIERAMQCEAPGPVERMAYAGMLLGRARLDEAERLIREVLAENPDYPEALGDLARVLLERSGTAPPAESASHLSQAEGLLRQAMHLQPRHAEFQNSLAVLLYKQGKPQEALPLIQRALQLRPDYVEARRNLAIALIVLGRPQEALDALQPLLQLSPADPVAPRLAAQARARLGRTGTGR